MVQVDDEVDGDDETIIGRVEHVLSGAVAEFDSPADLVRFIARALHPQPDTAANVETGRKCK